MLILLTIFLFIFTPLSMLVFYLVRPKLSIQGFLAVLAVLVAWPMVFLARSDITHVITLIKWQPESLFPISPSLLIDNISWYFALALTSLSLTVVITSIAQLGQSLKLDKIPTRKITQVKEDANNLEVGISSTEPAEMIQAGLTPDWLLWASILALTSFGLVAVTAGNLITLLLAWAALDIIELIILLGQMLQSRTRERIILVFSAKMAGIVTVLMAGIILWSKGSSLSFDAISQPISTYLVVAAGLRLGVLPLHLPFTQGLPIRRGLGTVLRLVPAASSYILLARVSSVGVIGNVTPYLLGLATLAGLYAAVNWLGAQDELNGRPYWLLGTASLAIVSAILNHPAACLSWGIVSLLSGGLIFSMHLRHRNLIPLIILGLVNLSVLPFSPAWQATELYQSSSSFPASLTLFSLFSFFFLLIQSFLLAGFIRHILRGIYPVADLPPEHIERWVWFLYPIGLIFIALTHVLIGWWMHPNLNEIPLSGWIMGPVGLIISGVILYIVWRQPHPDSLLTRSTKTSFWSNLLSLNWLYRLLWKLFRTSSRVFALISTLLEGDGGILWALVLFALIFVFLQR
jgi:hypothetical protein